MTFADIHNKRELEDVVQQLRLKQLPFTLETLEELRKAIQKPKLDEILKKYMERDFVVRWKQLCSQHNLTGWANGFRLPFPVKSQKLVSKVTRINSHEEQKSLTSSNRKGEEKRHPKTNSSQNPQKRLLEVMPNQFLKPTELQGYVTLLKNNPEYIPQYIRAIASRIPNKVLRRTFCDNMIEIYVTRNKKKRKTHTKVRPIDSTYVERGKAKVKTRISESSQGVYLGKNYIKKLPKSKYSDSKTDLFNYEYGLSDW